MKCTKCKEDKPEDSFWFSVKRNRITQPCNSCRSTARKEWKEKNREKVKAAARKWQQKNPDRMKAAQERWKANNPGIAAKRTAVWRANNLERARQAQRDSGRKLKDAAYLAYGGYVCACCGETVEAFLSLDHVNNDGAEHRKTMDRRKIYKWLQQNNYPEGFQVLCMNCNFGKARNGGVCPHKST